MPRLSIFLLGAPRIELNGAPVSLDTRKAIAMLAFLALHEGPQTRDTIAALLWPEYSQSRGRAALRRTLSVLKSAVDGHGLQISREYLGIDSDADIWIDVLQFRAHLAACEEHGHLAAEVCPACLGPLTRAAELYSDDFMAGFTLRDSPEFDEWQYFEGEQLRREFARVLKSLVHCHRAQRQFDKALAAAHRWLELDPLQESAHRQVMELHALAGHRTSALQQYRECVRILEEELGVPPLEETTHLYERILSGEFAAPAGEGAVGDGQLTDSSWVAASPLHTAAESSAHQVAPARLPLVGRSAEWARLLETHAAVENDGYLLILAGEAGIGKTRLAESFLETVAGQGAVVISAQCYEGESKLAYSAVVEGLRQTVTQVAKPGWWKAVQPRWLSEAARLIPELARLRNDLTVRPAALDSPGAQSHFFEGICQVITALCGPSPQGVLFLDDLHWADEATLDLLVYLARRLDGRPLLLLGTWRDDRIPKDHRLRQLLAESQRANRGSILRLERLDETAIHQLLISAMDRASHSDTDLLARQLLRETEGLPYFLVEYLKTFDLAAYEPRSAHVESLQSKAARGQLLVDWPMPDGVRDLLRSQLALVRETGRQLLQTAAVIGRSFDFDILREASGRDEEETIVALEELMARGLVVEQAVERQPRSAAGNQTIELGLETRGATGQPAPTLASRLSYDFSHGQLRRLVYEDTSLARRHLLHRRVAEALVARQRAEPGRPAFYAAALIASHYERAREDLLAAEYFLQAGDHALSVYANAEALDHYQSALTLGHKDTASLYEAIGDLHTLRGDYDAAQASYETAAAIFETNDQPGRIGRVEHKLGRVFHRRGQWELADNQFAATLPKVTETGERARLVADWSLTAHHGGDSQRAEELAQQALALANEGKDSRALAQAHNLLGILSSSLKRFAVAREHLEESRKLADALADPDISVAALNNLSLVYAADGQLVKAQELLEDALALCKERGDRHREAALYSNLADLLHQTGQSEQARQAVMKSVAIYAEIGGKPGDWRPEIWKLTEW